MEANGDAQRIVRLSRGDDGTEVWLDTQTGQELTGVVERQETAARHPLIALVGEVFDEFKWHWHTVGSHQASCAVSGRNATFGLCLRAYDDRAVVLCATEIPVHVPEHQRARALDYLNRVNWKLRTGNFELDPRDGEVRFRLAVEATGGPIAHETIRQMLHSSLGACDYYFAGLMGVVFAGVEPAEAIKSLETHP